MLQEAFRPHHQYIRDNMKKMVLLVPIALLIFLGFGCTKSQDKSSDITFNYPDSVQEQTTTPAPATSTNTNVDSKPTLAFPGKLSEQEITGKQIRIKTDKGDIVFDLFADTAPLTVSNFVYLTKGGYYNGLTFHRREEGFVIQGGDPNGNGTGGPGYKFADELSDKYSYDRGIVAMANAGPSTNGSQFFIMLKDTPLPKAYSIFGRVTSGLDVVDKIKVGDKMTSVTVEDKK